MRIRAPMMRIHTVAAGGGSILHYEDGRFQVGPDSAGANPGPACYRRGGPLAVTDANVMLGKLQPGIFSGDLRPRPGPAARRRGRAEKVRGAGEGDRRRPHAGGGRRGLHHHRRREHGQRHQEDFGPARLRRHRIPAQLLRRRRRPACLPRRRRARHGDRARSIPSPACCRPTASGLAAIYRLAPAGAAEAAGGGDAGRDHACWPNSLRKAVFEELHSQGIADADDRLAPASCMSAMTAPTPPCQSTFDGSSVADAATAFEAAHKAQFGFVYEASR